MLKVLLTNFHPGDGGGHTTYLASLIFSLKREDRLQLHLAVPNQSKAFQVGTHHQIPTHAIDFPGKVREVLSIIRNVRILRALIVKHRFELIHSNGSPDHRLIIYTLWTLPQRMRPRIVFTKHNSFPVDPGVLNKIRYTDYADYIICVCQSLKKQFKQLGVSETRISVIPNGVDLDRFHPQTKLKDRMQSRQKFGLPEHRIMFISCAGTASHKGWQILANALCKLPHALREKFCVVVLGSKPSQSKLESLLDEPSMTELHFPGHQDNVVPYLQVADVGFVLSTAVETISFACREMMACGLPTLVSDFGCVQENVDESTGWVVKAGSESDIEAFLSEIHHYDLAEMGASARQRALENFSIIQFAQQTLTAYQATLNPETK